MPRTYTMQLGNNVASSVLSVNKSGGDGSGGGDDDAALRLMEPRETRARRRRQAGGVCQRPRLRTPRAFGGRCTLHATTPACGRRALPVGP